MEWLGIFRIIYFLGAVNALFFSVLIFLKHKKTIADKILAWWLIILSLQVLYPFLYLTDIVKYQKYMGYESVIAVLQPAALYFYTSAVVGRKLLTRRKIVALAFTMIGMFGVFLLVNAMPDERLDMIENMKFIELLEIGGSLANYALFILLGALMVYFLVRSNALLKEYKQKVKNVYSNSDKVDLLWLRKLLLFFYAIYSMLIVFSVISVWLEISLALNDYLFYVILVIFVFLLGFWGHQHGSVFKLENDLEFKNGQRSSENKVDTFKSNNKSYDKEAQALKTIMEEEKPFLEPTLTLHDLAEKLDLPSHLLSKVIHKEFGKNFYEFVNEYRIESFKRQIMSKQYKNFTLLAIAYDCGFNSKSAFNRIFKEHTGVTPRDFKQNANL